MFNPTKEQLTAIRYDESAVITACPGSGKTAVVSEKVRGLLDHLPDYQGVIAISYTNKASAELKRRCSLDGVDVKGSYFGTIDKFCLSEIILPFLSHFTEKFTKRPEVMKTGGLAGNTFAVYERIQTGEASLFDSSVELLKEGVVVLETAGPLAVEILNRSAACKSYIQARYTHLFIDEYQDSGAHQHDLFLALANLGLIAVAVGDVRQSIYAFAGRDPRFLRELCEPGSGFKHFQLTQNHRSHPSIINYADRLLDENSDLLPVDDIFVYRASVQGTQRDIAKWIDSKIDKIKKKFNVQNESSIGVLVRNGFSAELVQAELKTPCRIFHDSALETSRLRESQQFASILRLRFDPVATVQGFLDEISFQGNRLEKTRLKRLLQACRTVDDEQLIAHLAQALQVINGKAASDESIAEVTEALTKPYEIAALSPPHANELQIMTLHKSKGLEFDVVIHLDLYDWILPKRTFVQGVREPVYTEWGQCLNLHYVGVTRARKACILVTSKRRLNWEGVEKGGAPSQFFDLPGLDNLYKVLNQQRN